MTAYGDMSAAGLRVLDLLTAPEAAARLGCSPRKVRRLTDEGVLVRERFGRWCGTRRSRWRRAR